jgi:hypothetical protein
MGLAQAGQAGLQANAQMNAISQSGVNRLDARRQTMAQILHTQGTYDANALVGGISGAFNAYTGIRTQQAADEQRYNGYRLGQQNYYDMFNSGGF